MSKFENLYADLEFWTPLDSLLEQLYKICSDACSKEDPKLFRKALEVLSIIEETLWSYYMEVYSK